MGYYHIITCPNCVFYSIFGKVLYCYCRMQIARPPALNLLIEIIGGLNVWIYTFFFQSFVFNIFSLKLNSFILNSENCIHNEDG